MNKGSVVIEINEQMSTKTKPGRHSLTPLVVRQWTVRWQNSPSPIAAHVMKPPRELVWPACARKHKCLQARVTCRETVRAAPAPPGEKFSPSLEQGLNQDTMGM